MTQQPAWASSITPDELTELVQKVFRKKYHKEMTPRARTLLRDSISREMSTLDQDEGYEHGTSSPEEAAEKFADLAAGKLKLKEADKVNPSPSQDSLEGYSRVAVAPISRTVSKAKAYHGFERRRVCPVWPF